MAINKKAQDELKRYTFIDKIEMKGTNVLIYYGDKIKKLPYRASIKRLIEIIEQIKEEIGFVEQKKRRDIIIRKQIKKPMMFVD